MNLGSRCCEARITFVLDQHHSARIRHQKVGPGDADICRQKPLTKHRTRNQGLFFDDYLARHTQPLREQVGHLLAGLVEYRRHDVIGPFMRQLQNILAQIGFNRFQMMVSQTLVQVHFFGDHGFGFNNQTGAAFLGEIQDEISNLFGVFRVNRPAAVRC